MALDYQVDSIEGMEESIAALYIKGDDGKYTLDVRGHEKPDDGKIPLSRLNAQIEKTKQAQAELKEIADSLVEDVPEDKRSIIPDLPPGAKISWLRTAFKMDFFADAKASPLDTKRPGDQKPTNFDNMTPQAIMATGYKSK